MPTIRIIHVAGEDSIRPIILLQNSEPDEDDYDYAFEISEIPEMIESACFMGDFKQRDLANELITTDQDVIISRQTK